MKPGYYWAKFKRAKNAEVELVQVLEDNDVLIINSDSWFKTDEFDFYQKIADYVPQDDLWPVLSHENES